MDARRPTWPPHLRVDLIEECTQRSLEVTRAGRPQHPSLRVVGVERGKLGLPDVPPEPLPKPAKGGPYRDGSALHPGPRCHFKFGIGRNPA